MLQLVEKKRSSHGWGLERGNEAIGLVATLGDALGLPWWWNLDGQAPRERGASSPSGSQMQCRILAGYCPVSICQFPKDLGVKSLVRALQCELSRVQLVEAN